MDLNIKYTARKVPQITLLFWIIKLLTTAMGEATSDYSVNRFDPYYVVIAGFFVFLIVIAIQFMTKRYIPIIYWLTVLMVAVFGTMAADATHIQLHIPYAVSSSVFAIALAVIFIVWKKVEGTLSIHSINTRRREVFYWLTVLATFALGTAAGDLFAYSFHFGFLKAGIIFAVIFAIPAFGRWIFKWNAIFSFWFAYILTRPLGASFADYTSKPTSVGGLGHGDGPVAGVLFIVIILLVLYLQFTHKDVETGKIPQNN